MVVVCWFACIACCLLFVTVICCVLFCGWCLACGVCCLCLVFDDWRAVVCRSLFVACWIVSAVLLVGCCRLFVVVCEWVAVACWLLCLAFGV